MDHENEFGFERGPFSTPYMAGTPFAHLESRIETMWAENQKIRRSQMVTLMMHLMLLQRLLRALTAIVSIGLGLALAIAGDAWWAWLLGSIFAIVGMLVAEKLR